MSNNNGTTTITSTSAADFAAIGGLPDALAQAIMASAHASEPRDADRAASSAPSFASFASMLSDLVARNPDLERTVQRVMVRAARQSLAQADAAVPATSEFLAALRAPAVDARGGTVVRAFWWGFHVQISREDLQTFLATAEPLNAIVGTIGGGVPSPAAPFIALVAAFIAGALGLLKSLDRGRGVYVSMSWFAPGIFIPTSV